MCDVRCVSKKEETKLLGNRYLVSPSTFGHCALWGFRIHKRCILRVHFGRRNLVRKERARATQAVRSTTNFRVSGRSNSEGTRVRMCAWRRLYAWEFSHTLSRYPAIWIQFPPGTSAVCVSTGAHNFRVIHLWMIPRLTKVIVTKNLSFEMSSQTFSKVAVRQLATGTRLLFVCK